MLSEFLYFILILFCLFFILYVFCKYRINFEFGYLMSFVTYFLICFFIFIYIIINRLYFIFIYFLFRIYIYLVYYFDYFFKMCYDTLIVLLLILSFFIILIRFVNTLPVISFLGDEPSWLYIIFNFFKDLLFNVLSFLLYGIFYIIIIYLVVIPLLFIFIFHEEILDFFNNFISNNIIPFYKWFVGYFNCFIYACYFFLVSLFNFIKKWIKFLCSAEFWLYIPENLLKALNYVEDCVIKVFERLKVVLTNEHNIRIVKYWANTFYINFIFYPFIAFILFYGYLIYVILIKISCLIWNLILLSFVIFFGYILLYILKLILFLFIFSPSYILFLVYAIYRIPKDSCLIVLNFIVRFFNFIRGTSFYKRNLLFVEEGAIIFYNSYFKPLLELLGFFSFSHIERNSNIFSLLLSLFCCSFLILIFLGSWYCYYHYLGSFFYSGLWKLINTIPNIKKWWILIYFSMVLINFYVISIVYFVTSILAFIALVVKFIFTLYIIYKSFFRLFLLVVSFLEYVLSLGSNPLDPSEIERFRKDLDYCMNFFNADKMMWDRISVFNDARLDSRDKKANPVSFYIRKIFLHLFIIVSVVFIGTIFYFCYFSNPFE